MIKMLLKFIVMIFLLAIYLKLQIKEFLKELDDNKDKTIYYRRVIQKKMKMMNF